MEASEAAALTEWSQRCRPLDVQEQDSKTDAAQSRSCRREEGVHMRSGAQKLLQPLVGVAFLSCLHPLPCNGSRSSILTDPGKALVRLAGIISTVSVQNLALIQR